MNGLKLGQYVPSSVINTDPLTNKYTVEDNIGRGKFAVVKKCINNETKEVVAAKFIKKRRKGKSAREEILREVVMLEMAMSHPRLVDLLEVYETPSELILITEYCEGGELFHECVIEESFQEQDVVKLVIQILEGLVFLHEQKIVHLDLKPQNILLTKPFPHGNIKICDLGFACLVHKGEDIRDIIGTADYVAPEVLDYEPLDIQTDMWSMGVLTYVMLTAFSPFAGDNQQETFCNISTVKLDFPEELFDDKSEHCKDFISKLLVKNSRKRLTARQCLEHPWLKSYVIQSNLPPTLQNLPPVTNCNADISEEDSMSDNNENICDNLSDIDADIISNVDNTNTENNTVDSPSTSSKREVFVEKENSPGILDIGSELKSVEGFDNEKHPAPKNCDIYESARYTSEETVLHINENNKNVEKSVSKVTYSVNKVIVLKPTVSPRLKGSISPLKDLVNEQSEITKFSENFEKKTELSSPTNEQKQFIGNANGLEIGADSLNSVENILHNPFNGSDIKIVCNSRTQRNSLPGRIGSESIKNKDKDESFKRRSMEIPVKRRKSENGDIETQPSTVQKEFNCVDEVTFISDTITPNTNQ